MKRQSKNIMLDKETIGDWLKNESLGVRVRWITVGLAQSNENKLSLKLNWTAEFLPGVGLTHWWELLRQTSAANRWLWWHDWFFGTWDSKRAEALVTSDKVKAFGDFTCNFSKILGAPWICWPSNVMKESSFCKEIRKFIKGWNFHGEDLSRNSRKLQLTLYMLTSELRWFGSSKSA